MNIKIFIPNDLFRAVEKLAKEFGVSRNEVFIEATREYLERIRSLQLLKDLNDAYSVAETAEDLSVLRGGKRRYASAVRTECS